MNRLTLLCKGAKVKVEPLFPKAMPITGPSSYIPTTDEFLAHWALANAEPGAGGAILLQGGIGHDQLFDSRTNLSVARDAVTDAGVERALAREELDALVTRLQGRLVEFNQRVRADLPRHPIARILPGAFAVGGGVIAVRDALRQMS